MTYELYSLGFEIYKFQKIMPQEVRLLQLAPIDGRDDIEEFWLRNRDLVFQERFLEILYYL